MSDCYKEYQHVHQGREMIVSYHYDYDHGDPWKEEDGHGPVSEWRDKKTKRPGEMIVTTDRDQCRFYDFQEATKIAKRDGWVDPQSPKRKQLIREAVMRDYIRLCRWCNNQWYWMGVMVKDVETDVSASLWGIESDAGDYLNEVRDELCEELYLPSVRALIKGAA